MYENDINLIRVLWFVKLSLLKIQQPLHAYYYFNVMSIIEHPK